MLGSKYFCQFCQIEECDHGEHIESITKERDTLLQDNKDFRIILNGIHKLYVMFPKNERENITGFLNTIDFNDLLSKDRTK